MRCGIVMHMIICVLYVDDMLIIYGGQNLCLIIS